MSKEKSSLAENVLSTVVMIVALGVVAWRVHDCKKNERAREQQASADKAAAEAKAKGRLDRCVQTVAPKDRNACIRCTCERCLDETEACQRDEACRSITSVLAVPDGGAAAMSEAQLRHAARTSCMVSRCSAECLGSR
jgi:hypothetical protein